MRENSKISSGLFILGLFILFQRATQVNVDFLFLVLLSALTVFWASYQQMRDTARIFQGLLYFLILLGAIAVYSPLPLPFMAGQHWIFSLWQIQWHILENNGVFGFVKELYDYATDPSKLSFDHWQYLAFLGVLFSSEGLVRLHRLKASEWVYLFFAVGCGLLWFTYLDVWLPFACLFIAYGAKRFTEHGKGVIFGLVMPTLITALAVLITAMTPIKWINEETSQWRNSDYWLRATADYSLASPSFGLSALGFYPLKDRLGGPVTLSKEILFKIKTKEKGLYLRGRVLTHYESNTWREEDQKTIGSVIDSNAGGKKIQYTIYDFKEPISTVLGPLSITQTNLPVKKLAKSSEQIVWYKGNLKEDYNGGVVIEGYDYAALELSNKRNYLQLPKNYAPEVVQLTQQVVKGAKTDQEKVTRIQRYLLEHYTYQLAVPVPPKERDFVSYFLTQSDSGYCVYFASAATLMARISGVPSRYVEGFITPMELFENRDTPVSGERAHAWAEVYYEGRWHVLETTPTFTELPKEVDLSENVPLSEETNVPLVKKNTEKDQMANINTPLTDEDAFGKYFFNFPSAIVIFILLWAGLFIRRIRGFIRLGYQEKQKYYVHFLLKGLCEKFEIYEAEKLSVRDILEVARGQGIKVELGGLVEIVEKSLYDSRGCSSAECDILEKAYWALYDKDFNGAMKLKWAYKIARKGRIFYGFNGKNSTT